MEEKTAKDRIHEGDWAKCWICEDAFRRMRKTKRYCKRCEHGFCEGEHGTFSTGFGLCIICRNTNTRYS